MNRKTANLSVSSLVLLSLCFSPIAHAQEVVATPPRAIGVEKQSLNDVGFWGIGAEIDGLTPLSSDLWRNADPETIGILFTKIGEEQKFTPLQTLLQRVIFAGGIAPTNDEATALGRFKLAARIGPIASSSELLGQLPRIEGNSEIAMLIADNMLMANKIDDACAIINQLEVTGTDSKLLKMRATCYIMNGEYGAAQLAIETIPVTRPADPIIQWMLKSIANISAGSNISNIAYRANDGMQIALSRKMGLVPNRETIDRTKGAALSAIVDDTNGAQNATMLRAASLSLISAAKYQNYAKDVAALVPQELPPATPAASITGPDGTIVQDNPVKIPAPEPIIGRNLVDILKTAKNGAEFYALSHRIAPAIRQIKGLSQAENAILANAAIIIGDLPTARLLLQDRALPYQNLAIALMANGENNLSIQRRLEAPSSPSNTGPMAVGDALLAFSSGLPGRGIATLLNTPIPNGTAVPSNALAVLDMAVLRGSKAEVALLAYYALQSLDPKTTDVTSIARVIAALHHVGLEAEARELALFSLLSRNIEFATPPPAAPRPSATPARPAPAATTRPASTAPSATARPAAAARPATPAPRTSPPAAAPAPKPKPKN